MNLSPSRYLGSGLVSPLGVTWWRPQGGSRQAGVGSQLDAWTLEVGDMMGVGHVARCPEQGLALGGDSGRRSSGVAALVKEAAGVTRYRAEGCVQRRPVWVGKGPGVPVGPH